jgi:hypothetical protein
LLINTTEFLAISNASLCPQLFVMDNDKCNNVQHYGADSPPWLPKLVHPSMMCLSDGQTTLLPFQSTAQEYSETEVSVVEL